MTRGGEKQKGSAARALHRDSKPLVGLLVKQGVRFGGAQNMPIEPVRTLGRFVLDRIEQGAIVRGPGDTSGAFESLRESAPGAQIFDLKHVLLETRVID